SDFYPTPEWLTAALLRQLPVANFSRILEPACGDGAIVKVLHDYCPNAEIVAGDLIYGQDFETFQYPGLFDLVCTNPPYSLGYEFVEKALEYRKPHVTVALLVRVSFLAGQDRARLMRRHTPSLYITPRRPIFVRGSSDNCEYSWFVWDSTSPRPPIILETETED